ncbi:Uncharacterised protein [Legionella beliardensis]|uniref:Alkaline phytoceramidase n=1 Tax=Legionella beliardensis TaxID=91822 RepID=A0A378IBN1_9GAMM|nr:alkaline phytoceramidase [Legionella beliardensis]STX29704.1 Uncharacterised protein [Legionella beliardensis]
MQHEKAFYLVVTVLLVISITTTLALALIPPIPQALSYHDFADKRLMLAIPNFFNVISNALFIIAGVVGLITLLTSQRKVNLPSAQLKWPYIGLFLGAILTGVGSAYYHWLPNNASLFWDRLPMGIIFMSFFSAFIMERINHWVGFYLLIPAILIASFCAGYWELSEQLGRGDLRLYGWSQAYPILMILLTFIFFSSNYTGERYLIGVFILFSFAKLAEALDKQVYDWSWQLVSGHTLKHVLAAGAIFLIIYYLKNRKLKAEPKSKFKAVLRGRSS